MALMFFYNAAAGVALAAPPASQQAKKPSAAGYALSAQEQKAVLLINADRKDEGLEPLKVNLQLSKLAADYASDMSRRKFFSHVDPDGKDPFDGWLPLGLIFPMPGKTSR